MRAILRRCSAGEILCVYLESDAGLGKSMLVAALAQDPGIKKRSNTIMTTPTGEEYEILGRDPCIIKIQVRSRTRSTRVLQCRLKCIKLFKGSLLPNEANILHARVKVPVEPYQAGGIGAYHSRCSRIWHA